MADLFPAGYDPTQLEEDAAHARTSATSADTKLSGVGINAQTAATQATEANAAAAAAKVAAESAKAALESSASGNSVLRAKLDDVLNSLTLLTTINTQTDSLEATLNGVDQAVQGGQVWSLPQIRAALDAYYNNLVGSSVIKTIIQGSAIASQTVAHASVNVDKSVVITNYNSQITARTTTSFKTSSATSYFLVEFN